MWSSRNVCNQLLMGANYYGCVRLGTDLFNHSKSNRALDKFSECQYNNVLPCSKVAGHFKWLVGHTK